MLRYCREVIKRARTAMAAYLQVAMAVRGPERRPESNS